MTSNDDWNWDSIADMADLARLALADWRQTPAGSAAERKAGKRLAFAFGRLDDLGVIPHGTANDE